MAETIIVRSTSGVLFEFDVPTTALAKERLDQQIAKGDLSIVPRESVEWVTKPDGAMVLVDRAPAPADDAPAEPAPKPKGKGKATAAPSAPAPADDAPAEEQPAADDDGNAPVAGA